MVGGFMELRELILSTLAELEEEVVHTSSIEEEKVLELPQETINAIHEEEILSETTVTSRGEEVLFLEGMRERLLVLCEGLQSPEVVNLEAKLEITLHFLTYLLATIEQRLGCYEKGIA
jgi:hypothetical protein